MCRLNIPFMNGEMSLKVDLYKPEDEIPSGVVSNEGVAFYSVFKIIKWDKDKCPARVVMDTGSTDSFISDELIKSLQLKKIGESEAVDANGHSTACGEYDVIIHISSGIFMYWRVASIRGSSNDEILLGMDFLGGTNFEYEHLNGELIIDCSNYRNYPVHTIYDESMSDRRTYHILSKSRK